MKLNDTVIITYRLFPITKKNGEPKEASVLGELVSGNVSLYIKGKIKDVEKLPHTQSLGFGRKPMQQSKVHYFIRKHGQKTAVHLNSSSYIIRELLYGVGLIFQIVQKSINIC